LEVGVFFRDSFAYADKMKNKNPKATTTTKEFNSSTSSSSLVARAGQIMAVMITLGLVSMIFSILVTESLNGDAAQINKAGALRMQAMRISRAYFSDQSNELKIIKQEISLFDQRLNHLLSGGLTNARENEEIEQHYQEILQTWQRLKNANVSEQDKLKQTIDFDHFVNNIDKLVNLLQLESEKKLSILRLIQGITLLLVITVAVIVLTKLNKAIILPLKQLVNVASEAGKGNFELKALYHEDNELGVLAHTINQMSDELKSTYLDFEQRVTDKTQELTRSNQSLNILYKAAKDLANFTSHQQLEHQLTNSTIKELEQVLGFGKIIIEFNDAKHNDLLIDVYAQDNTIDNICFNYQKFPLEKRSLLFGYLVWEFPKNKPTSDWQKQILQAMADIIATAIELDQKRITENRLIIVEERAVIARELHDSLAQSLSYLKVQMSLLTRKMQKELAKEQVEETIDDIKEGLNKAYQQLRELLTTFRLKLDDPSIENALSSTVTEFSAKCQHAIEFKFHLPQNYLSANQEIHLLQIIREALSNIHRHAKANKAGVIIEVIENKVKVVIWDNGIGLPEHLEQQGHFGLGIMEERAKSLGSLINLQARETKGTLVSFEFSH